MNTKNRKTIFLLLSLAMIAAGINFLFISSSQQGINTSTILNRLFDSNRNILKHNYHDLSHYLGGAESIASASFSSDSLIIDIRGFRSIPANQLRKSLSRSLHPTKRLGLYSLNYLLSLKQENDITPEQLDKLKKLVIETLNHIDSFNLLPDRMKFNDHVVAARLESLILIKAYFEEHNDRDEYFRRLVDRHIHSCIIDLLDDKKFTWQTNHGLMQIRALLAYNLAFEHNDLSVKVKHKIEDRLGDNQLLDYHIAKDGSVYEASTDYWRLVYDQLNRIASFPLMQDYSPLNERLLKTESFLRAVAANNGFMQGVGDSYSTISDRFAPGESDIMNYSYRYSNGVAGLNLTDGERNIHLKFVSLDNRPHVKKHPEDLSLYLFYNQPYFINPGIYAYENSPQRRHVLSQETQNTVYLYQYVSPDSSSLFHYSSLDDIVFQGVKHYGDSSVWRKVVFNKATSVIYITDRSDDGMITSGFNIHPDIAVEKIDSLGYSLIGERTKIVLKSNVAPRLITNRISDKIKSMVEVKRLVYQTDLLELQIHPQSFALSSSTDIVALVNNDKSSQRFDASVALSEKYRRYRHNVNFSERRLIKPRIGLLAAIIVFLLLPVKLILRKSAFALYISILLIDAIYYGIVISRMML